MLACVLPACWLLLLPSWQVQGMASTRGVPSLKWRSELVDEPAVCACAGTVLFTLDAPRRDRPEPRARGARAGAQGGCIIRAQFLDEIREAYSKNPDLKNLLVDPSFAQKLVEHQGAWRKARARPARQRPRARRRGLCGAAHAFGSCRCSMDHPGPCSPPRSGGVVRAGGCQGTQCCVSMHAIARDTLRVPGVSLYPVYRSIRQGP